MHHIDVSLHIFNKIGIWEQVGLVLVFRLEDIILEYEASYTSKLRTLKPEAMGE